MYQCKDTGEYYMYKFYEVNSGLHYLSGPEGVISVDTELLNTQYKELDYDNGYQT